MVYGGNSEIQLHIEVISIRAVDERSSNCALGCRRLCWLSTRIGTHVPWSMKGMGEKSSRTPIFPDWSTKIVLPHAVVAIHLSRQSRSRIRPLFAQASIMCKQYQKDSLEFKAKWTMARKGQCWLLSSAAFRLVYSSHIGVFHLVIIHRGMCVLPLHQRTARVCFLICYLLIYTLDTVLVYNEWWMIVCCSDVFSRRLS